jgi:hypothetical protein
MERGSPLALLRRCVDDILWHVWDPIGVNDVPRAREEYDSYVDGVFALIRARASAEAIARHLHRLETETMGSRRPSDTAPPAAQRLAELVELLP